MTWNRALLISSLVFVMSAASFAEPGRRAIQPEYGEYVGQATVFQGYQGVWTGNNQDRRFQVNGEIVYSSKGGWVRGYGPGTSGYPAPRQRRTERFGRAIQPEYGEYISQATIFGGHRGYWSGNNQDQRFVSGGQIIYSSRGGWVKGYEPKAQQGGANITVYYAGASSLIQADRAEMSKNKKRIFLVQDNDRRTRTFVDGNFNEYSHGDIVTGSQIGKGGLNTNRLYMLEKSTGGYTWAPVQK